MSAMQSVLRVLRTSLAIGSVGLALGVPASSQGGSSHEGSEFPSRTRGIAKGSLVLPENDFGEIEGRLYDEAQHVRFELRGRLIPSLPLAGGQRAGELVAVLRDADGAQQPAALVIGHWVESQPGRGRMQGTVYERVSRVGPLAAELLEYRPVGVMAGMFVIDAEPCCGDDDGVGIDEPGDGAGGSIGADGGVDDRWAGGPPIRVHPWSVARRIESLAGSGADRLDRAAGGGFVGQEPYDQPRVDVGLWRMSWELAD